MIMTPRVPTLAEDSTDVGTEEEPKTPEKTPEGFAANSSMSKKSCFYEAIYSHTNLHCRRYREGVSGTC